ncbi:carbohydrate ABC transporter ATP-binding protein, CUT1 family [Rathayibacter oskolensis]|uniref:Carbohydrate ABC transporter ATP-binding protein, CUT1 family n=1 Tax=Rathayibacter oskolensis TaxID=1891671 RepID=A0A1X7MTS9_9MICO|nr:ABC transporter ATP-binding protein [Rathayibacter oskolensis]SMH28213.1 carbohydrate ABC transporter ATP-binding protein, CUT1 family [Rathayibacter oskolensis]
MASVELASLTKTFGAVRALDGIDLRIEDGEHVAVLGPSGSGKSTLLRVIAGLEDADSGTVSFAGVSQAGIPAHQRDAAIVFQHFALYPHLSSLENITLGLRHGLGLPKKEAEARARDIAGRMQVEHLLDRRPKQMSGGQRQRIALARALARRSGIVLLDEPLSGLDAQLHAVLRLEIATLLRSVGATGINVTHDQLDAMAMADRIAVIRDGRIEQLGTPDELYAAPATLFVAGFIGTPPMNLMTVGEDQASPFGAVRGAAGLTLGVRAEQLRLASGPGDGWSITGVVELVEPTGKDRVVHLRTAEGAAVALRCDVVESPRVGSAVSAVCGRSDVHVYDSLTGARLGDAVERGLLPVERVTA